MNWTGRGAIWSGMIVWKRICKVELGHCVLAKDGEYGGRGGGGGEGD